MTAFQTSKLSGQGAPETPAGGSALNRLKSRISLFLELVDLCNNSRSGSALFNSRARLLSERGGSHMVGCLVVMVQGEPRVTRNHASCFSLKSI